MYPIPVGTLNVQLDEKEAYKWGLERNIGKFRNRKNVQIDSQNIFFITLSLNN